MVALLGLDTVGLGPVLVVVGVVVAALVVATVNATDVQARPFCAQRSCAGVMRGLMRTLGLHNPYAGSALLYNFIISYIKKNLAAGQVVCRACAWGCAPRVVRRVVRTGCALPLWS